jgi:hypothetical protein
LDRTRTIKALNDLRTMFVELLWIDSLVRSALTPTKESDAKPKVTSDEVVAALGMLHRDHPAIVMNYHRNLKGFADLCRRAGMPSASDVAKRVPVPRVMRSVARSA